MTCSTSSVLVALGPVEVSFVSSSCLLAGIPAQFFSASIYIALLGGTSAGAGEGGEGEEGAEAAKEEEQEQKCHWRRGRSGIAQSHLRSRVGLSVRV